MNREIDPDEMLPEYDFTKGVRGRYAGRFFPVGPWSVGQQVVLNQDVPEERLRKGDVGEVWAAVHRHELRINWEAARAGRPLDRIPGLE